MELSPLMQTAQANAFYDSQRAQAQAQAAKQKQEQQQQDAQAQIEIANTSDPHRNPFVAAGEKQRRETGDSSQSLVSNLQSLISNPQSPSAVPQSLVPACVDTSDLDNDGLKKCEEDLLGTNPRLADTDGDGLNDGKEVAGFAYNSQTWYSDPQKASTLDDGILDGQKCSATQFPNCPDLDNDGIPNLFDRDIDGDGVSNALDLSPLRKRTETFGENNALSFVVNNLAPNKVTYVEFQLRPTNEKHLWYAFNVLDWVQGDKEGQIQRDGDSQNTTFYDVCVANGETNCKMSPDDNGDIKLVPMLEIRMSGYANNLPSAAELQPYGIFTKYANWTTYAYVPLQLVTEKTGDRAAFYGKMLYRSNYNASWGGAQQARLVWAVQMLTDVCQASEGGVCTSYVDGTTDYHNQVQIVQTYYDDFKITAMNVRENRGTEYALVYEDPAVDDNLNLDLALVPLALGLDSAFLSARDCDTTDSSGNCVGDGKPDVTVNGRGVGAPKIETRFDRTKNGGYTEDQRWGIPNTLRVVTKTYNDRDRAVVDIGSTEAKNILNSNFTSHWSSGAPITPTILYASEDSFRAIALAPETETSGGVAWSGSQVTFDMNGIMPQTVANINWTPYRYDSASNQWLPADMTLYWAELARRYAGTGDVGDTPESAAGKIAATKMHYLAVYNGVNATVKVGDTPTADLARVQNDSTLKNYLKPGGSGARAITVLIVTQLDLVYRVESANVFTYLGYLDGAQLGDQGIDVVNIKQGLQRKFGGIGESGGQTFVGVFAIVTIVTLLVGASLFAAGKATGNDALLISGAVLLAFSLFIIVVVTPILAVKSLLTALHAAGDLTADSVLALAKANPEVIGMTKYARAAGLVFDLALPWGFAMYSIFSSDLTVGSIAFNTVIAGALASTIVSLLLFALGSTVIGAIVTAVLAFLDLLLLILCQAGVSGTCWSVIGTITKAGLYPFGISHWYKTGLKSSV